MKYSIIKNELLEFKSSKKLINLKSLFTLLFMSLWGFSSGQPAIIFKGTNAIGSGNSPEMTIKSLKPKVGSAAYWEFLDAGVWRPYGGTGYTELPTHIGDYRAWYKHGFLGTYEVTNILTVADRGFQFLPNANQFETDLSDNEVLESLGLNIIGSHLEPALFPNPFQENFNIVCSGKASYSLMVYNEIGLMILNLDQLIGKTVLETNDWKKGVYIIQIKEENSTSCLSRKLIKI